MNSGSSETLKEKKKFYFFIENEFVVQTPTEKRLMMTINLVKLSKEEPVLYKIYWKDFKRRDDDDKKEVMKKTYESVGNFVRDNFIPSCDPSASFIGCVRDDNESHKLCKSDILGFECRTDPTHDIFNILLNIIINKSTIEKRTENGVSRISFSDELRTSIPNLPTDKFLETFVRDMVPIFSHQLLSHELYDVELDENDKMMIEFIKLLKKIYQIQNEDATQEVLHNYKQYYQELKPFSFENAIRCLESLKQTMNTNINTFEELLNNNIKFKPKDFSTLVIEGEKWLLRANEKPDDPADINNCIDWFKKVQIGRETEELDFKSGFGLIKAKFENFENNENSNSIIDEYINN